MKPNALRGNVLRPILLLTLLPLLAAGCGGKGGNKTSGGNTYTVRAQVAQLPTQGNGGLMLEHEPIDNYVARSGKVEGMDSMTMPFPVAKDVSLEGIQPKDIVEVQQRSAARAPQVVDGRAGNGKVAGQLRNHPLDLGVERHGTRHHVVEHAGDLTIEREVGYRAALVLVDVILACFHAGLDGAHPEINRLKALRPPCRLVCSCSSV